MWLWLCAAEAVLCRHALCLCVWLCVLLWAAEGVFCCHGLSVAVCVRGFLWRWVWLWLSLLCCQWLSVSVALSVAVSVSVAVLVAFCVSGSPVKPPRGGGRTVGRFPRYLGQPHDKPPRNTGYFLGLLPVQQGNGSGIGGRRRRGDEGQGRRVRGTLLRPPGPYLRALYPAPSQDVQLVGPCAASGREGRC